MACTPWRPVLTTEEPYQQDPVGFCIQELKSGDPAVRYTAVDILRACGPDSGRAVKPLLDLLQVEQDLQTRRHIAFTLQDIARYLPSEMAAVEAELLAASRDEDQEVRSSLASLFAEARMTSPKVLTRLQQMVHDPDPEVSEYSQRSLEMLA